MTTTFVFDGHEIEVENKAAVVNLRIDGETLDHAKGLFKPEKNELTGTLLGADSRPHTVRILLVSAEGVYKAKLFVDEKLTDVRYMI